MVTSGKADSPFARRAPSWGALQIRIPSADWDTAARRDFVASRLRSPAPALHSSSQQPPPAIDPRSIIDQGQPDV